MEISEDDYRRINPYTNRVRNASQLQYLKDLKMNKNGEVFVNACNVADDNCRLKAMEEKVAENSTEEERYKNKLYEYPLAYSIHKFIKGNPTVYGNEGNTFNLSYDTKIQDGKYYKSGEVFNPINTITGNVESEYTPNVDKNAILDNLENKKYNITYCNGGEIQKYNRGGLHPDLQGFKMDLMKLYPNARITSEVRPGAKTKQGKPSRHATGEAIDIAYHPDVLNFLWNTTEGTSLLSKYDLGLLDESTPEMLQKTGGTGAHLHVGKDTTIPSGRNRHIELMQAQLKKINEDNAKKEQQSVVSTPQSTEQVKTDEQTEAQIQQNDESQNEYLTAAQIMEANRREQANNMNNILSRYNSTNDEWMQLFQ
jgi:hypothetical protein